MKLHGKTVVITGASRGIGKALSHALSDSGCRLLLTALEEDELAALAESLVSVSGGSVAFMAADLVDRSERERFVEWISSRTHPPDILINNAGAGRFGRFATSSWNDIEWTIELGIQAPIMLTHKMIPVLRNRPEAKIVLVSSAVSRLPYPGLSVYGATKGFLSSFSESLACELKGSNISVLCFHPGFTDTHFMSSAEMDMRRIPRFAISSPRKVASRIVRAIARDKVWAYSDLGCRLGVLAASVLPSRVRTRLFRDFYWRLTDDD